MDNTSKESCDHRDEDINPEVVCIWACSAISLADFEDDDHSGDKRVETKCSEESKHAHCCDKCELADENFQNGLVCVCGLWILGVLVNDKVEGRDDEDGEESLEITRESVLCSACVTAVACDNGSSAGNGWANIECPFDWDEVVWIVTFSCLHKVLIHERKPCPEESQECANDLTADDKAE